MTEKGFMRQVWFAIGMAFAIGAASGCDSNSSGELAARTRGDLSHVLDATGDSMDRLVATCGSTGAAKGDVLRRRPYLQKVSDRSASILWTADAQVPAFSVMLSTGNGAPVSEVPAIPDKTATPPEQAKQWQVTLGDLSAETVYCYELRAGGELLRRGGFQTAPSSPGRKLRLVAFGDSGDGGPDQFAVMEQMRRASFDLLIHTGDIAYGEGSRGELESFFFGVYADLLEFLPVFPTSGNHDYGTEGGAPFREAFALPENGGPTGLERWYSYDYGPVHFAVLDTERMGPEQAAWLDADLAATRKPWTIVYGHRPPFSSGDHGSDRRFQTTFVPILKKHRVPLVLSGHDHHYERTVPIDGVTYVVTGGGGVGTRPVGRSAFTAFSESVLHFLYVEVDDNVLTANAVDATGAVFDTMVLRR